MGNWFENLFGAAVGSEELPEIFPFPVLNYDFIKVDVQTTYVKILTDVAARIHGLSDDQKKTLWDSCVQSDANAGLITLLSDAMTDKKEIFLVFKAGVLRKATQEEERQIRDDYKAGGSSKIGAWVSFKLYKRTDMLRIYSGFEYCLISSLHKNLNTSKALQLKISKLREAVSLADAAAVKASAQAVAKSLGAGRDVMIDAADTIETAKPDTSTSEKAMLFLDAKRAFYLGLPLCYIVGEQTSGLNSSGEADTRAIERGLYQYFVSIMEPVLQAIFNVQTSFKSLDFRQISSAMEVLKGFALVDDTLMSAEDKKDIVDRLFDIDPDAASE